MAKCGVDENEEDPRYSQWSMSRQEDFPGICRRAEKMDKKRAQGLTKLPKFPFKVYLE
ncbi:hypothetical protein HGM15179_017532, partial [Zosterops borbonicus]